MATKLVGAKYSALTAITALALALIASAAAGAFTNSHQQQRVYNVHPHPMTTTVSGSTTGAIFEAINSSFTAFNTFGLEGIVANAPGGIGVLGYGNNGSVGNYGVYGSVLGPNGTGVYGYAALAAPSGVSNTPSPSTLSTGLIGLSHTGFGLIGQADWPNTSNELSNPIAGVEGVDMSSSGQFNLGVLGTTSNGGWGVAGESGSGALGGVFGYATNGTGVFAESGSGAGLFGESASGNGVFALSSSLRGVVAETSTGPAGVEAFADGVTTPSDPAGGGTGNALYVQNNSSFASIWGYQAGAGEMMGLESAAHGVVLTVDNAGNVHISGTITTAGSCSSGCSATRHALEYAPRVTQPTLEDVGEAQMVGGQAYVRLDPAFANVIDLRSRYMVFITPEGDSNGMFVTAKSPAGFMVRENRGGHSSLAFQYRIVAQPYGVTAARLPMVTTGRQAPSGFRPLTTDTRSISAKMARFISQIASHSEPRQLKAAGPSKSIH